MRHQPLRGGIVRAQSAGRRIPVDDQTHGLPQLRPVHVGGHLVDEQHAHGAAAAVGAVLSCRADDRVRGARVLGGLRRALEPDLDPVRAHLPHVIVVLLLHQRGEETVAPVAGAAVRPVAHEPRPAGTPALAAFHSLLLHRHGGRRCAHRVHKVRAHRAQRHHEGVLVLGVYAQRLRVARVGVLIARHHGQDLRLLAVRLRCCQPPPGVHEILCRHLAAVGPLAVAPQVERVRLRAVLVVRAVIGVGRCGHRALRRPAVQVVEQVQHQGALRRCGGIGRVYCGHAAGHHHRRGALAAAAAAAAGQQRRHHAQAQQHGRAPLPSFHRTSSGNRLFSIIYAFAPKVKPPSGRPHFVYNYSAISSWAICTALVAAPLRTWSPQHQMFSPLSLVRSSRIRPTNTRSWSLVSSGIG